MVLEAVSNFMHVNLPRSNSTATSIETICENKWRLQEEEIKMASIYPANVGQRHRQPMYNFITSQAESHLKELKRNDQRVRLFEQKINHYKVRSV